MTIFRLAKQHGRRGYFAEINLRIDRGEHTGLRIVYNVNECRWRRGIEFGIAYAFEKCGGNDLTSPGITIHVDSFSGHEVDTKQVVAAYVAACAYFGAVGEMVPEDLRVEIASGVFSFPK